MTLILGMSKDEGMYLSVDYRISNPVTGKLVDDAEIKFLSIQYAPLPGGPLALVAYTGIARVHGTPTGTWLRETLRGESETFDNSMTHLRARLDRDAASLGAPLIVNMLVLHGKRRYLGALSNLEYDGGPTTGKVRVAPAFGYVMNELSERLWFANGLAARTVMRDGHADKMQRQLPIRPNRIEDHMKLLATINRRVAATEPSVSPYCHVTFIPVDPTRDQPSTRVYTKPGESAPFAMPFILGGADLTLMAQHTHDAMKVLDAGGEFPSPDIHVLNASMKRRD